jgi:type IV pilus assembly protein PilM
MAAGNLVGLDIGTMSVRAVETSRGKDGYSVARAGAVPLAHGVVQSGVIQDDKAVTAALKQLWTVGKFRSRNVALAITNPQIVVREMAVANLPTKEMRKALPFQVRDALPLPVERSILDFFPMEEPGQNETVRGLLIAAPKDALITAVQAAERAGLHVARVDLASFALLRAASKLDEQVEAIVDIGAHSTSVVVHNDGQPLIVRTIPRGGAEITEALASRLGRSLAEAETLKCEVGMLMERDPDTAEIVRDAARPLINEIRSSFAYLSAGERPTRVARLALSGGGAMLPGLDDALRTQLGVEVLFADATARMRGHRRGPTVDLDQFRPSAAVSIGLTLGAAA